MVLENALSFHQIVNILIAERFFENVVAQFLDGVLHVHVRVAQRRLDVLLAEAVIDQYFELVALHNHFFLQFPAVVLVAVQALLVPVVLLLCADRIIPEHAVAGRTVGQAVLGALVRPAVAARLVQPVVRFGIWIWLHGW